MRDKECLHWMIDNPMKEITNGIRVGVFDGLSFKSRGIGCVRWHDENMTYFNDCDWQEVREPVKFQDWEDGVWYECDDCNAPHMMSRNIVYGGFNRLKNESKISGTSLLSYVWYKCGNQD